MGGRGSASSGGGGGSSSGGGSWNEDVDDDSRFQDWIVRSGQHNYNLPSDPAFISREAQSIDNTDIDENDTPHKVKDQHLTEKQNTRPWAGYQQNTTGKDYEEWWQLPSGRRVQLDGVNEGYIVEPKWTGKNDAAYRSTHYNPKSETYKTKKKAEILDQVSRQIEFAQMQGLNGVRWCVSAPQAQKDLEKLFREEHPDLYKSGFLQVWHVPGTGMQVTKADKDANNDSNVTTSGKKPRRSRGKSKNQEQEQ